MTAEIADRPGKRLYVFSDMMQHADWYSHLDTDWEDWHDAGLVEHLGGQATGAAGCRGLWKVSRSTFSTCRAEA